MLDFTLTVPTPRSGTNYQSSPIGEIHPQGTSITTTSILRPVPFSTSSLSRLNAKAAEGGFCDWIKQLIQKICSFFGLAAEPETSRANRLLEEKITEGKQIIDRHMQEDFIVNANASNQAIIIIIQYNGECKIDFGKARNLKNDTEIAKGLVREVLTRHASAPNAKLEIDTILIRKNNVNDYDYQHFDNSINYADGRQESGGGGSDGCSLARLGSILLSAIPDRRHQQAVANFIRHRL